MSRTSTEQYRNIARPPIPEIGRKLNANFIVEGSGQKYGNRFILRVQLIAVHNERHLWGNSYDREILKTSDIIMCEADGYCTRFYLHGNSKLSSSRNLKFYADILPSNVFIRTHNSFVINLNHVKGYSNQEEILLTDGLKCPLSLGNKNHFMNLFKATNKRR